MKNFKFRVGTAVTVSMVMLQLVFVGGSMLQVNAQEADNSADPVVVADTAPVESAPATDVNDTPVQTTEEVAAPVTSEEVVTTEQNVSSDQTAPAPAEDTVSAPVAEPTPVVAPELTSDKADYHPGETASIFGRFFQSLQNIVLRIFGDSVPAGDNADVTANVTTDESGSFTYQYQLDPVFRPLYTVVAYGTTPDGIVGPQLASMTFTDASGASKDEFSQCANDDGDGYVGADVGCHWTNGDLNSSNSRYYEDDATVQRLAIDNLTTGDHTVIIKYSTTKGGKHSYDFMTDDNYSELAPNSLTSSDLCDPSLTNLGTQAQCAALSSVSSNLIPSDPNAAGHDTARAARHFKIRNGSWVAGGISSGPTLISGTYAGDSDTVITLKFHVDATTCLGSHSSKCEVLITWGAHVSSQADWGTGNSAVNISGSPYHVQLADIDGSSITGGGNDNQMSASAIILPSTITIHKVTANGDTTTNFIFNTAGTGYAGFNLVGGGQNLQSVSPGSYSVTEPAVSGWSNTALTCTASGTGSSATPNTSTHSVAITIGSTGGATIDCTYTNTLQTGHVIVIKDAKNNNAQDFTFHDNFGNGNPATFQLDDDSGATGANNTLSNSSTFEVLPGNYSVTEDPVAGWKQASNTCSNITVAPGATVTCTITNEQLAKIILVKNTVGGDGTFNFTGTGTSLPANMALTTSAGTVTQTFSNIDPDNTYTIAESVPSGWTLTTSSCSGTNTPAKITPNNGETVTCTFTNTKDATLTLVKTVVNDNGGNKVANDFQGKVDGNNIAWNVTQVFPVGLHTASETNLPGYTAGNWGEDCAASGAVTLAPGQNKTCTITNDDQAAHLILIKHVVNNNGATSTASAFTLNIGGVTAVGGSAVTGAEAPGVDKTLSTVGAYSVTEPTVAGYATAYSADCAGTIALGETKTCTVTNDDLDPILHVIKHVINDNGGTKLAGDFNIAVNGVNPSPANFAGSETGTTVNLDAGAYYTVVEGTSTGYVSTYSADCSGTLAPGEERTCTITNDDVQPKLTVTKVVINHGGHKVVSDFPLFVGSTGVVSGVQNGFDAASYLVSETGSVDYTATITGDCDGQGNVTLVVGGPDKTCTITNEEKPATVVVHKIVLNHGLTNDATHFAPYKVGTTTVTLDSTTTVDSGTYFVTEAGDANYTATYSGDCDQTGSVTVTPGSAKSCTITNEEIPTHLTVKKVVINHGQNKVETDFGPFTIDSNAVTLGTSNVVDSGTHTVAENTDPNYTQTFSAECANGLVTLLPGDDKTCTITNEEKPATLTLVKHVVNNNGGTKQVSDFGLNVDTTSVVSGQTLTVDSGAHNASEVNLPGYQASVWSGDCAADGSVTLAPGENKTCEITNDDIAPSLTLVKNVVNNNGGTAVATDWTLTGTGPTSISGPGGVASGATFSAGTYALSESGPAGYTPSAWTCVGGTQNDGSVTLGLGESATCTITNDDQPGTLIVKKVVVNDNGGTLQAQDFSFQVNGESAVQFEADGQNDLTVNAGTYLVTEPTVSGYLPSYSNCSNLVIPNGGTATCTITNNDVAPQLTVIKHVINDDGDVASASDFTMQVTGSNVSSPSFPGSETGVLVTLNAGNYSVDEALNAGYAKTLGADCSGSISVGQAKTCTITNNDLPHATRTQGFWQTHTNYTTGVFSGFGGGLTIGASPKNISTTDKLFAAFYANISKTSTGAKRSALDQARMQMLQQWVAAKLNCQAFTCSAATNLMLTNAATAWAGTNTNLILSYASQLDAYNNSNDALPISGQGKATPGTSQTVANPGLSFWNLLP